MNPLLLAGHTIDESRLPDSPIVLDVGCRGFDFSGEILRLRSRARVVAMDPDPVLSDPKIPGIQFVNKALIHGNKTRSRYASYSTGEGNMLTDLDAYYDAKMLTVDCVNIGQLMEDLGIGHWDLIKFDCEGSEFGILENWPGPIADQISVEFHDGHPERDGPHRRIWEDKFSRIFPQLSAWYSLVQHIFFKQGEWYGHWDSLLVKK